MSVISCLCTCAQNDLYSVGLSGSDVVLIRLPTMTCSCACGEPRRYVWAPGFVFESINLVSWS